MDTSTQEKSLLEGLAREDKVSIETIYREHFKVVQGFILANNGTPDDAADIFQEAMIVLFEKSKQPDFELNCQIRTYLYSVSKRLWLKRLQQMNRFSRHSDDMELAIPVEEDLELHEKKQADFHMMENALNKIGEPCKSLLESYYILKKPMQQIATDFGYTNADNAKTQKYKCLVRLKKLFFAQYKQVQ